MWFIIASVWWMGFLEKVKCGMNTIAFFLYIKYFLYLCIFSLLIDMAGNVHITIVKII